METVSQLQQETIEAWTGASSITVDFKAGDGEIWATVNGEDTERRPASYTGSLLAMDDVESKIQYILCVG